MDEKDIRPVFDLATERRQREIEALPAEERMMVERVILSANSEKTRADREREQLAPQARESFRQQILSGQLAPHLQPRWAKAARPSREELEMRLDYAVREYSRVLKHNADARIDRQARLRVDAVLALARGKSETPEQRLKAMEQALAAQSRRLGRQGRDARGDGGRER